MNKMRSGDEAWEDETDETGLPMVADMPPRLDPLGEDVEERIAVLRSGNAQAVTTSPLIDLLVELDGLDLCSRCRQVVVGLIAKLDLEHLLEGIGDAHGLQEEPETPTQDVRLRPP